MIMALIDENNTDEKLNAELGIVLCPPPGLDIPTEILYLIADDAGVSEEFGNEAELKKGLEEQPLEEGEHIYIRFDEHARLLLEARKNAALDKQESAVNALFNATPAELGAAAREQVIADTASLMSKALEDLNNEINAENAAAPLYMCGPDLEDLFHQASLLDSDPNKRD